MLATLRRCLLVGMLIAALAPATPVGAEAFDDDGGTGSGGDEGSYNTADIRCFNGEGWIYRSGARSHKLYDYPFSQCPASAIGGTPICPPADCRLATTSNSAYYSYEPTHIEVWRFYGTRANPVMYWSVSRVNLITWGVESAPLLLFAPHPNDAGVAGAVAPFQSATGTNRYKERYSLTTSLNEPFGRAHTTEPPFRNSGGSCNVLVASDNPYRSLPSWARDRIATRYNEWSARWGAATALALANLRSMSPMTYDDNIACSSGIEFARPAAVLAADPGSQPVFGSCWIPVERRATNFTSRSTGLQVQNWQTLGGHRYDDTRYPAYSTSSVDPTTGAAPAYHMQWRNAIFAEVLSRQAPDLYPAATGGGVFTPGDPYYKANPATDANRNRKTSNRFRAAGAAGIHAHCADGPSVTEPPQAASGEASMTVTLTTPEVFNVTPVGNAQPQRVSATVTSVSLPGPRRPDLPASCIVSVSTRLNISTIGGFNGMSVTNRTSGELSARRGGGGLAPPPCYSTGEVLNRVSSRASLFFTKPTTPAQKVRVAAEGSAVWRQFTDMITVTTPACSTCAPEDTITITYFVWQDKPVQVVYENSPVTRPVFGATATWRN